MQPVSRKPVDSPAPRMQPLARLPLFLDLQGRRAVVAGDSAAAGWKVELLTAAGATVVHLQNGWSATDLDDAALAVIDARDEREAEAFHAAARKAGVICNVIDRPAFCDVQFGAIVNRSPVVIGISTDGAAPVLAQAIRRRIETVLPAALAGWAAAAKRLRQQVMAALPTPAQRRAFWERFAERAFTEAVPDETVGVPQRAGGHVTLVGAGPGDAELLTLKAMRALQSADVILFDDLVSDGVLELARREARRMLVGKRGRRDSCRQEDINAMMIRLARQGRRVVRLKSGDPMVFGRAGEEIACLEAAGIPVEIVPGVTAAMAAAARLGVSLTHRDNAHSLRFVTGHARDGRMPQELDWHGLADAETTLVFYMAGRTAPEIANRLIQEGLSAATPAVAMASVSRHDEQRWTGRLGDLVDGLPLTGTEGPVLVGIGRAFAAAGRQVGPMPVPTAKAASGINTA